MSLGNLKHVGPAYVMTGGVPAWSVVWRKKPGHSQCLLASLALASGLCRGLVACLNVGGNSPGASSPRARAAGWVHPFCCLLPVKSCPSQEVTMSSVHGSFYPPIHPSCPELVLAFETVRASIFMGFAVWWGKPDI